MTVSCSADIGGRTIPYTIDIGKRKGSALSIRRGQLVVKLSIYSVGKTDMASLKKLADEMISENADWVLRSLKAAEERSRLPVRFENGEEFSLLGRRYSLRIIHSGSYRAPEINGEYFDLYISSEMDAEDAARLFSEYVVSLCRKSVMQAFDKYIPMLELAPERVTIKTMTSRWGSCSSNGNISINLELVCFEQKCIDYVVVHELCHLRHMNHSEDFWRLVATCCPDYKELRERLRR